MAWLYLVLAGMFEMCWPTGFKMAQVYETSGARAGWIAVSAIGMAISGLFLYLAQREIPVGVAYATWAAIGAVGTFLLGVFYFQDPTTIWSWVGVAFIVMGIAMLKMATMSVA